MKRFFNIALAAVIAVIFTFTGCSKKKNDGKFKITATFYPLYIMLLNITENAENVSLQMLAPADTGCLHDYSITTKDMKLISQSDVIVANGAGMEDFLDKALELTKGSLIIASENYPLIDQNAHIWVSPAGAAHEVKVIAEGLARADPKNGELYKKNAAIYIEEINSLYGRMQDELKAYENSAIITFHEAFPYFASDFKLNLTAVIEREPGTEPTQKEIYYLMKLIRSKKAENEKIALFAEPQYSSSAARIIANETGLRVYQLDPCVTGALNKDAYITAMEKNLTVLKEALKK
ncbi:metal ABC transporter substrate-binding protein [Treponema sp.]|uniref:metal ABC transporter substrate-binding protein n=1 Tax=Treponema sp. TaxID=166 RepID=UPI0025EA6ACB|nr:metal ABC transporter substrate-binding protein [Treponema sp.]MCR5218910.1 metal ABC transporter substrate-binding protein [Treponema sp.]